MNNLDRMLRAAASTWTTSAGGVSIQSVSTGRKSGVADQHEQDRSGSEKLMDSKTLGRTANTSTLYA